MAELDRRRLAAVLAADAELELGSRAAPLLDGDPLGRVKDIGAPLLVVIDDGHWMDSASWELVRAVARDVHPVMIVLLTRPDPEPPAGGESRGPDDGSGRAQREFTTYLAEHGALLLGLEPLAPDVTEQIACDALAS